MVVHCTVGPAKATEVRFRSVWQTDHLHYREWVFDEASRWRQRRNTANRRRTEAKLRQVSHTGSAERYWDST